VEFYHESVLNEAAINGSFLFCELCCLVDMKSVLVHFLVLLAKTNICVN